jgi:small-conductance mechanosensitive channel/CRP-like cAMP-binding protein
MNVWEHLQQVPESWSGFVIGVVALAVVFLLRVTLRRDRRRNTTMPAFFLLVGLGLHMLSTLATAGGSTWGTLNLFTVFFLALGMTGLAALLVFDVVLRRQLVPSIVRDMLQAVLLFIIVMVILRRSGVDLLSLLTTSAVLTAIVGLALQNTIQNLFAGLALPVERTFGIGDWVRVGEHVGRIVEMQWRATLLVTKDGDSVIVPNNHLLASEAVNYSKPSGHHRVWIRVGFHYRHPPNVVRKVLLDALRGVHGALTHPPPDCFPVEFGESAVIYALRFWIDDYELDPVIGGEVHTRVWYAAQRAGLEIPFPIRTLLTPAHADDHPTTTKEEEHAERLAALATVDLFGPLEHADREVLTAGMRRVSFAAGERIIEQGDPGDSLYLLRSGEIAVHLTLDGAGREVARVKPGDFFGEMSLVTGEPRQASCTACSDVVCYVIGHKVLRKLLDTKPKLAEDLSAVLVSRQMALDGQREGLSAEARARRTAEARSNLLARIRGFFQLH